MSLVELKKLAKNHEPPIKQYYIKTRAELIGILTMKELPESFIVEKKKIGELRIEAKNRGYKNIWSMKRAELMDLLYPQYSPTSKSLSPSSHKNNQNNNQTQKHYNPEESECEDVRV